MTAARAVCEGCRPVAGTERAPPRRLVSPRASASSSGVREAERPRFPTQVVELSVAGGRQRAVRLASGGSSEAAPHSHPAAPHGQQVGHAADGAAADQDSGPLAPLVAFFLPRGWRSGSVTSDYLRYQLSMVPAHITGWMSHSLATSSMIQALGVDAGPAAAVATSAAIKWITKDGLGAAGRLIVGGQLASVFDEDPRRWRMVAEGITTAGLALEIATRIYPAQFVLLAGAGTLAKSMAKGMGRPAFRVIQTHFAATNNVGDVAAKEEVWEVAAQLLGLASSVALLQLLESVGQPEAVVPVWAAVHGVHVALRYVALRALRFPYPNQKRAALMATQHISSRRVPSIEEANMAEQILLPPSACRPWVCFGCTLDEALAGMPYSSSSSSSASSSGSNRELLSDLVQLYRGEQYLLTWHSGRAWVALLEGARPVDLLRATWQAAWLDQQQTAVQQHNTAAGSSNGSGPHGPLEQLAASLSALQQQWPDFAAQAAALGWELDRAVLPRGRAYLRME